MQFTVQMQSRKIRVLGDQFRPKLRECWVRYLAVEESGQSVRQLVCAGQTKRTTVDDKLCPTTASGGIKADLLCNRRGFQILGIRLYQIMQMIDSQIIIIIMK